MADAALPSISIVVPNYNAAATLERTLRSLLDQGYPSLEILVADGGSTDGSVEIIRRYEQHLAWWVSERDRGQSSAINRGFAHATGEVVNWLCSDDYLLPGALRAVGEAFGEDPGVDVVVGRCRIVYEHEGGRETVQVPTPRQIELIPCRNPIGQPSCFYRRGLLKRDPPLDESLHYTMDLDLWASFNEQGARWRVLDRELSVFPQSGDNKTASGGDKITAELERVYRRYVRERVPLTFWHRRLRHPLERLRKRHPSRLAYCVLRPAQLAVAGVLVPFYGGDRVRMMNWAAWV